MQRVLMPSLNGKLNTSIFPHRLESVQAVHWHGIARFDIGIRRDSLRETLSLTSDIYSAWQSHSSYDILWRTKLHLLLFHGAKDDLESMQQILKDCHLPLFALLNRKAFGVYQSHLLQDCRLARFSGACQVVSILRASAMTSA